MRGPFLGWPGPPAGDRRREGQVRCRRRRGQAPPWGPPESRPRGQRGEGVPKLGAARRRGRGTEATPPPPSMIRRRPSTGMGAKGAVAAWGNRASVPPQRLLRKASAPSLAPPTRPGRQRRTGGKGPAGRQIGRKNVPRWRPASCTWSERRGGPGRRLRPFAGTRPPRPGWWPFPERIGGGAQAWRARTAVRPAGQPEVGEAGHRDQSSMSPGASWGPSKVIGPGARVGPRGQGGGEHHNKASMRERLEGLKALIIVKGLGQGRLDSPSGPSGSAGGGGRHSCDATGFEVSGGARTAAMVGAEAVGTPEQVAPGQGRPSQPASLWTAPPTGRAGESAAPQLAHPKIGTVVNTQAARRPSVCHPASSEKPLRALTG